jgi:1-deoxy-D-xylulose-5-phosphate synthase
VRRISAASVGSVAGGVGSAVARELRTRRVPVPVRQVALPHEFIPHGERGAVLSECGMSAQEIARTVVESLAGAGSIGV